MGWSCGAAAGSVLEAWSNACAASSGGSSNVWEVNGTWYMYEVSRKEHNDGAITGLVSRFIGNPIGKPSCMASKAGSFRIEGNGEVTRGPKILKEAYKTWKAQSAEAPPAFLAEWPSEV